MTCFSDSAIFNFPRTNSSEYSQDTREIEIVAARALKNINLLYNEIMSPKDYQLEEPKDINNELYECASNVGNQQNHYLKSCCSTLLELCAKCDKFISRCSTCNRCNCGVANANFQKYRNIESHKNIKSTTSLANTRNRLEVKCTVPEPFSFYDKSEEWQKARESKITKMKEEINAKIDSELKIRAHGKPVPKNTHLPLYKQMVQVDEKRKVERKEKCIDLLNSTKPFNLHTKDSIKAKSSVDLTIRKTGFKAKPVPKHILSNKVSEKLQNKEEIRKMLITERAKDLLKQSASPISKKAISHSRSMIDLMNYNKPSDNKESKKNISEITKRLYVKKCNETMKSWNKKVSEVNNHKAEDIRKDLLITEPFSLCKKGLSETKSYPFLYFPVRMSNAAMLREKQIRAEILARKEREEKKNNEELMKKKINTDILHRLRNLVPASEWEKEVDEKVKMFRESQMRRKEEYEKELQEIMKRVSEQTLLLERHSKNTKIKPKNSSSDKSSEVDEDSQEVNENEKSHKSVRSDSEAGTQETESSTES